MRGSGIIVAAAVAACAVALPVVVAAPDEPSPGMRDVMREMQRDFEAVGGIVSADDGVLADALAPLASLQSGLVAAKSMAPPDLDIIDLPVEESVDIIRRRLLDALRSSVDLELAILDGDHSAAREAYESMRQIQRDGHNVVQFPLREARRAALLATLDNLPVDDALASNLVGKYEIAEAGVTLEVIRNEAGGLTLLQPNGIDLVLWRQAGGEYRPVPAPQVVIRFADDTLEIQQQGRVIRAVRTTPAAGS